MQRSPRSPISPGREGFLSLQRSHSSEEEMPALYNKPTNDEHIVDIPLTPIRTNISTGARKEGQSMGESNMSGSDTLAGDDAQTKGGLFSRHRGRRRAKTGSPSISTEEEDAITTMGRFYEKVLGFSIVTRYLLYVLPLALIFLIVILIGRFAAKNAEIGGVPLYWFFFWLEIVWVSLWVSKLAAKALPLVFQTLVGVVSSGVKKYALVIQALEFPLSLVGWAVASLASFLPVMTRNPHLSAADSGQIQDWEKRVNLFLISCLVSSLVFLAEKVLVQIVSVDYHRRQFSDRIKTNKQNVRFLSQLYEVSRNLFPEYTEFADEDYIIHEGLTSNIVNIPGLKKNSKNPMRQIIGNLNHVQDAVTSAFGNVAQEITGNKNVFNPNGAYTIVLDALQRKKSSEALARRIWMSFVPEGSAALTREDLLEVMGQEHEQQASDCFMSLDRDGNGDVSLDEMILHVMHIHNERFDVAKSMQDVDNAIRALDNVLMFIVFVVVILVFVIAQQSSIGTTIAGAGTVLISLSFVFANTAAEVLGSCIFLFVKHPFDVGDRVDIDSDRFIVEHISLLYTVMRRIDNHKTTQFPNSALNTSPIENITRSIYMKETITISIQYDTPLEDIQKLKEELLLFVGEHSRDYQPDLDVEIVGLNALDKLELNIDLKHRSNWSNEGLTCQRRNKFYCALVLILKRIPIYGAGGGGSSLGEMAKPMFTVQLPSQVDAEENMKKAAETKEAKRWDYKAKKDDPPRPSIIKSPTAQEKLDLNFGEQRSLSPFVDDHADDMATLSRQSSESRREDFSETRGLLARSTTKGRRKPVPNQGYPGSGAASAGTGYQYPAQD